MVEKFKIILFLTLLTFNFTLLTSPTHAVDKQISITATVPANANHVQLNLASLNTGAEVSQDTSMDFELTYGSYLSTPADLTIEVEGRQAVIEGSGAPSIDIADYVYGSASNAINNIPPVIDPVKRKIIWNIMAFPANTLDKKLHFALRTNSSYTGSSKVNFGFSARIIGPGFVTPDKTITKTYKYDPNKISSGPAPSPTPSATVYTTIPTTTVYTPGYIPPSVFRNIFIPIISQTDAKIFISTFGKYFSSVRYGQTPRRLTDKVTSLNKTDKVALDLTDLKPDSTYYFKAEIKDESGRVTGTEIFTFKTAEISDKPEVEKSTFLVTSQSSVISSAQTVSEDGVPTDQPPNIVIPKQTIYEIRFALKKGQSAKKVQAIVRNKSVLGISTVYAEEPNTEVVDMVEVEPGVYSGSLKSKPEPGYYEQFIRIEDDKGNIAEEKVADIKVLNPFTVLNKETKQPLEGARVLLYLYNPTTKIYNVIPPSVLPIGNPAFTDHKGELNFVLAKGQYKVEVSDIGHKDQTVEFTIGPNPEDGFPIVSLESAPFNPLRFSRYIFGTATEVLLPQAINNLNQTKILAQSIRIFDFIATAAVSLLVLLGIISFYLRTHMHFFSLKRFFLFHATKASFFTGRVLDEASQPISKADVFLIDEETKQVIDQAQSNKLGQFYLKDSSHPVVKILVVKKGYEPAEFTEPAQPQGSNEKITIKLQKSEALEAGIRNKLIHGLENILSFSFELILGLTIVFEILFLRTFGILKTAPFLAVSLINLLLWLLYLKQVLHHKSTLS